uniref:Uncharacterized protein n=1 Tax=Moniliophthora roreri TaxID=221103 RepID=A0A0W0F0K6_MONRR
MSQRIKEIVVETVLLGLFNPSFALFFLALWDWSRWSKLGRHRHRRNSAR